MRCRSYFLPQHSPQKLVERTAWVDIADVTVACTTWRCRRQLIVAIREPVTACVGIAARALPVVMRCWVRRRSYFVQWFMDGVSVSRVLQAGLARVISIGVNWSGRDWIHAVITEPVSVRVHIATRVWRIVQGSSDEAP